MKKFIPATLALIAAFGACLTGCGRTIDSDNVIIVGASQTPHAQILEVIKDDLADKGYTLEVKVFDDYILPNTALEGGELDANYFQHTPYLNTFNAEHGTDLVSVGKIHYEPFGVYGNNVTKEEFSSVKTGRTILIPNDGSNLARALFVLQDEGYITLREGVSANDSLTVHDIADDNGNDVKAVLAETVAVQLAEADAGTIAVINGNFALQAGLDVKNALAVERADGEAAQLYANVIAVKAGNEEHPKIKALLEALRTQKVSDYIRDTFNGAVLPVFEV